MAERAARTPEDRAMEAFGILERKATKAAKNLEAAEALHKSAKAAHDEAQARLEYAGQNPDLPESIREQFVPKSVDPNAEPDSPLPTGDNAPGDGPKLVL